MMHYRYAGTSALVHGWWRSRAGAREWWRSGAGARAWGRSCAGVLEQWSSTVGGNA